MPYFDNIARYVRAGGAVLVSAGPDYASTTSIWRTPLDSVLPAEPVGVSEKPFYAHLSDAGKRHPVTRELEGSASEPPHWSRFFRTVETRNATIPPVMTGADGKPLLLLSRYGEGRVALLLSDHIWLWARGYEGGGPLLNQVRSRTDTVAVIPADRVDPTVRVLTVGGRHPLRDPKSYPLRVRSTTRVPEVTTLTAVGDVMLARRVGARIRAEDDWSYPLRPLARRLAAAEITVGNVESTLSRDGSPTQGTDSFGADRQVTAGAGAGRFRPGLARQQPRRGLRPAGAAADPGAVRAPIGSRTSGPGGT